MGQGLADGQAQTRAAMTAGGRLIGLGKLFKNFSPGLLIHAQTGIPHRNLQGELPAGTFQAGQGEFHLPLFGKFTGITAKVEKDLANPNGITDQDRRQMHILADQELDILILHQDFNGILELLQDGFKPELNLLKLHLSFLYLGEIKDIVNYGEQGLGRFPGLVQVCSLLLGEPGFQGQIQHAENGIHGGPDLMAHVGQEVRLGLGSGNRPFPLLDQLLLEFLLLLNIEPANMNGRLVIQNKLGIDNIGPEFRSVRLQMHPLKMMAALVHGAAYHLLRPVAGIPGIGLHRRAQVGGTPADDLFPGPVAKHHQGRLVAVDKDPVPQKQDRIGGFFINGPEDVALFIQFPVDSRNFPVPVKKDGEDKKGQGQDLPGQGVVRFLFKPHLDPFVVNLLFFFLGEGTDGLVEDADQLGRVFPVGGQGNGQGMPGFSRYLQVQLRVFPDIVAGNGQDAHVGIGLFPGHGLQGLVNIVHPVKPQGRIAAGKQPGIRVSLDGHHILAGKIIEAVDKRFVLGGNHDNGKGEEGPGKSELP